MSTASGKPPHPDQRLEIVVIPVSDVDRSKRFYSSLGWRLDADFANGDEWRVLQMTPPGSASSVMFGKGLTTAAPGSVQGTFLGVEDIEAARAELLNRDVPVSEVFHFQNDQINVLGDRGRLPGADPQRRSYFSFAWFSDPDGNGWLLREITTRFPGGGVSSFDVATLTDLLRVAEHAHGAYERSSQKHHWSGWSAGYRVARQQGNSPEPAFEAGTARSKAIGAEAIGLCARARRWAMRVVKAAGVQLSPVPYSREGTIEKVVRKILASFLDVRRTTERLAARLSPEDAAAQSMPDASPTKWHLGHTSWFFATFVLSPRHGFQPCSPAFGYLFNSYCGALGIHHEQQHQELILRQIKHLFEQSPLYPAYHAGDARRSSDAAPVEPSAPGHLPLGWRRNAGGLVSIGHDGSGFAFDDEGPDYRVYLEPYELGTRLGNNAVCIAFIQDGGYERPELWRARASARVMACERRCIVESETLGAGSRSLSQACAGSSLTKRCGT